LTDKAFKLYLFYCKKEKLPSQNKRKFSISISDFCHGAVKFLTPENKVSAWRYVKIKEEFWNQFREDREDREDLLTFLHKSENFTDKVQASSLISPSSPEPPEAPID